MSDILIRRPGERWAEPIHYSYDDEAELQELLASHPQLIPGITPGAKTCREFQSEVGPADIIVVEVNGAITLVECKLAKNPQIRREIIGQLFDYAGRLWQMSADQFDERWRSRNRVSLFSGDHFDDPVFRETVSSNLADGRFRLVLAVDEINPALKRMVEYVNGITSAETSVIAVEYVRYRHGDVEVLTPRTYGDELSQAKVARQISTNSAWDHSDYRDWLTSNEPTTLGIFDELSRALSTIPMTFRGGRGNTPSGTFVYTSSDGFEARPLQLSTIRSAILELNFADWVASWKPSDDDRGLVEELMKQWAGIPELNGAMNQILSSDNTRRRSIPLATLTPEGIGRIVLALRLIAG